MSMNDVNINPQQGADVYAGVRNPTDASMNDDPKADNFLYDPTTDKVGAGADPNKDYGADANRGFKATAGVIEGRPGIIESSNIDPLTETANKDDGWANATIDPTAKYTTSSGSVVDQVSGAIPSYDDVKSGAQSAAGYAADLASTAATAAAGAGKFAYGHVTGDDELKQQGKEDFNNATGTNY